MKASFFHTLDHLPAAALTNDRVFFRPIKTETDLAYAVLDCSLTDEQQELVNPAGFSIGRAYLNPDDNFPCIICGKTGKPVGFINLLRWLGAGDGVSWSYYIDLREQGNGYGKAAAELAITILSSTFPDKMIKLSTEASNCKAQALYKSLGLQQLSEMDGDDLVFGLSFGPAAN